MNQNLCFRYLHAGLPEDIQRRKLHGDFAGAVRLIDQWLDRKDLPHELRCCLTAQREMILRTEADYPYTHTEALERVRQHIPDFSEEEFDHLVDQRKIGWLYIDGEMRYFNRFLESVCKAEPAFAKRAGIQTRGVESAGKGGAGLLDRNMQKMQETGSAAVRIRIRASVQVKDQYFTPGMFVRAHLPIPAACDQQSDIRIEKLFPANGMVAPEDAPQRTVCWEESMTENHEFFVEYSYLSRVSYNDVDKITADTTQPDFCTGEEPPHILFTPYIRMLVEQLSKDTDDPLEKARRFYDFITLNMKYNFMPAYFILENIADSCARSYTGDCGVFALLFLTMCRCAGIPAQWQSGLTAEPDFIGGHDWVRFYIAPYGWLFADTSYGTAAVRAENEVRRKFYFGNLDPYRMVANNAFQAPFTVEKQYWRTDPYDNQLGEIETADRGLRYEEFIRFKEILQCEPVEE